VPYRVSANQPDREVTEMSMKNPARKTGRGQGTTLEESSRWLTN
jgi:hypothetical protein